MTIEQYRAEYYADASAPPLNTVRQWIRDGRLPAEKRGKRYYIDTDKLPPATGNALADRVLRRSSAPRKK